MSTDTIDRPIDYKSLQVSGSDLHASLPGDEDNTVTLADIFKSAVAHHASEQQFAKIRAEMQQAHTSDATIAARVNTDRGAGRTI